MKFKTYVQSYEEYQRRDLSRSEKALHLIWVAVSWQEVGLNIVYILSFEGYQLLVIAHCDLFSWVKAKPLCTLSS